MHWILDNYTKISYDGGIFENERIQKVDFATTSSELWFVQYRKNERKGMLRKQHQKNIVNSIQFSQIKM